MDRPDWAGKGYAFFSNTGCEFFPCHAGADRGAFNCLFCYCPLYALGRDCGGQPRYIEGGIKDCSGCLLPHRPESYGYVTGRFQDIIGLMAKQAGAEGGDAPATAQ